MSALRTALTFLTVMPLPAPDAASFAPASSIRWFPFVGLVMGLALSLVAALLFETAPPTVAGVLVLILWVVVTGALHVDGLADSADASLAPLREGRRLAILKDPTHGTFAVVSVVLLLLLKFALLVSLSAAEAAAALLLVPIAARAGVLPAMRVFPPLGSTGMGAAAHAGATLPAIAIALGFLAGACVLVLNWAGLVIAAVTLATAFGVGWWLWLRLGGLNGDGYGAMIEVTETGTLLAVALLVWNGRAGVTEVLPWI